VGEVGVLSIGRYTTGPVTANVTTDPVAVLL